MIELLQQHLIRTSLGLPCESVSALTRMNDNSHQTSTLFGPSRDLLFRNMAALALAQYGSGAALTALLHPFGYAKVLMQVGHEPLAPVPSTTFIFRRDVLVYPNIFKYMGHIKEVDGFRGLYRGVVPRVLAGTFGNMVQINIQGRLKESESKSSKGRDTSAEDDEEFVPWLQKFAQETSEETISRCCGVIASHPFHVIMVRSMVQFVGRETKYNSIWSSTKEIYEQEGILGFFAGLVPRLIGEVITIWFTNFLARFINKYLVQEKLVVSHLTYPFTLVTNVMAVSGSRLYAGQQPIMPVYKNWTECMSSLSRDGDLKRGASAFWRVYKPRPVQLLARNVHKQL
ncbi:mitochondrial carrier homolog 2 [Elysia marginata]|uniref:Mitochondrial carrier homolog 2 n=1 Tax=Elysia marginata TaxID=1093978 RepID=A0AAV4INT5_9GAST|nr:mitochondrial carrier homolog 2 [Elysia marginata]